MKAGPFRIAALSTDAFPGHEVAHHQPVNTLCALQARGHQVSMAVGLRPDHRSMTAEALSAIYTRSSALRLDPAGVRKGGWHVLNQVALAWRLTGLPTARAADILLTRKMEVVIAAVGRGLPVLYDHYRPWPDQYPLLNPLLRAVMGRSAFKGALLHSDLTAQSFARARIAEGKCHVVHNGFDAAPFDAVLTTDSARAALGLAPRSPVALYAGRITATKGLDQILAMAWRAPEVQFWLVGAEGEGGFVQEARAVPNVCLFPWVAEEALPLWLQAADVLLIPPASAPLARHGGTVLPAKTFPYLASGRPILAPDLPDTRGMLVDGETARLVPPDEPDAAVAALRALLAHPEHAALLGKQARAASQRFTWDARAQRIEAIIAQALACPDPSPTEV